MNLRYTVEVLLTLWKGGAQSKAAIIVTLGPNHFYAEGVNRAFRNNGDEVQMVKGLSLFAIRYLGNFGTKIARWHKCDELTTIRNQFPAPVRESILNSLHEL